MCDGFWLVDVAPSPKVHSHDVGDPVEVSVKDTASGAAPVVGVRVNDAVGAAGAGVPAGRRAVIHPTSPRAELTVHVCPPVAPAAACAR